MWRRQQGVKLFDKDESQLSIDVWLEREFEIKKDFRIEKVIHNGTLVLLYSYAKQIEE